jgi:hypothetical protein
MALAGYNPNASLLPTGNAPIQPMSGGGIGAPPIGFNPQISLLPSTGGEIDLYRGGFFNEPVQIIGGKPPIANYKPIKLTAQNIKSSTFQVSWENKLPDITYTAIATPDTQPTTPSDTSTLKDINGILDTTNPIFTFDNAIPATKYNIVIKAQKMGVTDSLSSEPLTITTLNKNSNNTSNKKNDNLIPTKEIILFGEPLTLDNPKLLKDENFTESQTTALQKFGLDGPGLSFSKKRDVVQALFDGQCNTDLPLIFKRNCDPIREIVQSLALNLLSKMKPTPNSNIEGLKSDEVPEVIYSTDDKGNITISLKFKPESLSILSRFGLKPVKPAKLEKPSGLKVITETPTTVSISWNNYSDDVTYSASATPINNTPTPIEGKLENKIFTFSGLIEKTSYNITITAKKDNIEVSSKPFKITLTSLSEPESIVPKNLSKTKNTTNGFIVSWDNPVNDATYIATATSDNGTTFNGTISSDKKDATFENLSKGIKYTVTIQASKDGKTEQTSIDISFDTDQPKLSKPTGISAKIIKSPKGIPILIIDFNILDNVDYDVNVNGPDGKIDVKKLIKTKKYAVFNPKPGKYVINVIAKKNSEEIISDPFEYNYSPDENNDGKSNTNDSNTNSNTNSNTDSNTNSNTDSNTNSNTDSNTNSNTDSNKNTRCEFIIDDLSNDEKNNKTITAERQAEIFYDFREMYKPNEIKECLSDYNVTGLTEYNKRIGTLCNNFIAEFTEKEKTSKSITSVRILEIAEKTISQINKSTEVLIFNIEKCIKSRGYKIIDTNNNNNKSISQGGRISRKNKQIKSIKQKLSKKTNAKKKTFKKTNPINKRKTFKKQRK